MCSKYTEPDWSNFCTECNAKAAYILYVKIVKINSEI